MRRMWKYLFKMAGLVLVSFLVMFTFAFLANTRIPIPSIKYDYVEAAFEDQVPFASTSDKWNKYKKLEEDSYGRVLFLCKTMRDAVPGPLEDYVTESNGYCVIFYLILQRHDKKYVQVYDNDCYLYALTTEGISDSEILAFKERNDWDRAYDETKILEISLKEEERDPYLSNDIKAIFEKDTNITLEGMYLDRMTLSDGREYFVLRHVIKPRTQDEEAVFGSTYLFRIQLGRVADLTELEGLPPAWNDQIRAFKEKVA